MNIYSYSVLTRCVGFYEVVTRVDWFLPTFSVFLARFNTFSPSFVCLLRTLPSLTCFSMNFYWAALTFMAINDLTGFSERLTRFSWFPPKFRRYFIVLPSLEGFITYFFS